MMSSSLRDTIIDHICGGGLIRSCSAIVLDTAHPLRFLKEETPLNVVKVRYIDPAEVR
jgi:hypothetical protein